MNTKHCSKCNTTKPVSEFYKNRAREDGLQTYCKPCMTAVNVAATRTPRGRVMNRARNRKSAELHRGEQPSKPYKRRPTDPARHRAHVMVEYAVKHGWIVKPTVCSITDGMCDGPIEGHHTNGYDKANHLTIQWLCRRHHKMLHRSPDPDF